MFLIAAGQRLRGLGSSHSDAQLQGHDIHTQSLMESAAALGAAGFTARLVDGDFFDAQPEPTFDAVIGNLPYIRWSPGRCRGSSCRRLQAESVEFLPRLPGKECRVHQ